MAGQLFIFGGRPAVYYVLNHAVRTRAVYYYIIGYIEKNNGAHSCDDDEIAMAIICLLLGSFSGYKSERERERW